MRICKRTGGKWRAIIFKELNKVEILNQISYVDPNVVNEVIAVQIMSGANPKYSGAHPLSKAQWVVRPEEGIK